MTFSSQHHSFDIHLAAAYGMQKAILIHHLQHWIRYNRKRKKNIRNGKCYSYQSRKDIEAHFPYLSFDSVRHHMEGLVENGILIAENFNRAKFDKTLWYAFADEKKFGVDQESIDELDSYSKNSYERGKPLTKGENPLREGENPQPIPDTKTKDTREGVDKSTRRRSNDPAPSAKAAELSQYLLHKIKERKPNFTKKATPTWNKDMQKLLEVAEEDRIRKVIDWIATLPKHFTYIQCPAKLLKEFDAQEMRMEAQVHDDRIKRNRDYAQMTATKYKNHYRHFGFDKEMVKNLETGQGLYLDCDHEDFKSAFHRMFGVHHG